MKRLLILWVLLISSAIVMVAQTRVTVTGVITDVGGNPATSGTVTFALMPTLSNVSFSVAGIGVLVPLTTTCGIDGSGNVKNQALSGSCLVWGNDVISPGGTTYTITTNPNGSFGSTVAQQCILGAGPYDMTRPNFCGPFKIQPQYSVQNAAPWTVNLLPQCNGCFNIGSASLNWGSIFANNLNIGNINNTIYVGSLTYPMTPTGIQNALNQASTNGGGTVILPATQNTPLIMGTASLLLPANGVCLIGQGKTQTVLKWLVTPTSSYGIGSSSPVGSCIRNLEITFASGINASGLRISGNDVSPALNNTFDNLLIDFSTLGASGSACIYAAGTGPAQTNIVLNHFTNINCQTADQAVLCTNCEGNTWDIMSQNTGAHAGVVLFNENGFNNNEHIDARMETGSGNFINEICYQTNGNNNQVRLTCDGNLAGITAVSDLGDYNLFDIGVVGSPTLGTIAAHSQYRYVNGSLGFSQTKMGSTTFATLPTTTFNGDQLYCSNCTVTTPASCTNVSNTAACTCVGGGTGAVAKRVNSVWLCN